MKPFPQYGIEVSYMTSRRRKMSETGFSSNLLRISSHCLLLLLLSIYFHTAQAQTQSDKSAQKNQDEVITLKAHLVSTDVIVKDKKGKYITDLKAEDFILTENGIPQRLEFFDPPLADYNQPDQLTRTPSAGKSPNIISLVIDGQSTELANLKHVREGTIKYIKERMNDSDMVAVFAISSGLGLLQSFTNDKAKIIKAIENAYSATTVSRNLEHSGIEQDLARAREELRAVDGNPDPQSQLRALTASLAIQRFLKFRSQLSLQQSRPILAAIAAICEAQFAIPGKKTVVLFSQGFVTSSTLDWQVQGTIDIANRANVAIYIIDSGGLVADAPKSGSYVPPSPLDGVSASARAETRIRTTGGENVFDHARHEGLDRQQDILFRISGDTGGEFLKGNNDISRGLDRIDQQVRARYTLAYYSSDANFDGNFRKLKIEVRKPDVKVVSREGYYAVASDDVVMLSPEEKKLMANFAEIESKPGLPLSVELTPFRGDEGRYIVPISIELPPSSVKFNKKGDKQIMHLDVLGVVREPNDKIVSRLGGNFNVGMGADQYQSILNDNIFYRQDMELAPGTYNIELLVIDKLSGKMAARREKLILPAPDSEFAATEAVLSRNIMSIQPQSDDVLSQEGVQIRPSPSRVFRTTDNLIIFFAAYNAAINNETGKPLVRATVTLKQDEKSVTRPIDYMLTEFTGEPVQHLTFAKYISLKGLAAGKYTALIEIKDMVTRKLVTQQKSFAITQ
jgi:VWFA-related protein